MKDWPVTVLVVLVVLVFLCNTLFPLNSTERDISSTYTQPDTTTHFELTETASAETTIGFEKISDIDTDFLPKIEHNPQYSYNYASFVYDIETRVMYMVMVSDVCGYEVKIIPLYNADGSLRVYELAETAIGLEKISDIDTDFLPQIEHNPQYSDNYASFVYDIETRVMYVVMVSDVYGYEIKILPLYNADGSLRVYK